MSKTPIGWTVEFNIAESKVEEFRSTVKELVAALEKAEPGTLWSQWFLDPEVRRCRVHVWCTDQEALIAHATGIGPSQYLPKLLGLASLERFDVLGTPEPQLAKILEAFPVTSRSVHMAGFSR